MPVSKGLQEAARLVNSRILVDLYFKSANEIVAEIEAALNRVGLTSRYNIMVEHDIADDNYYVKAVDKCRKQHPFNGCSCFKTKKWSDLGRV